MQTLLARDAESAPIVTLGGPTRPENRRMMELLRLRVTEIEPEELYRFERVIAVDTQARDLDPSRVGRLAIVDHHPDAGGAAELRDIRPRLAACATMVTEYLRAVDERRIGRGLATALLYGIKTDSDSLTRGVTPADVRAYAFLQARAQLDLVRRIERPMYSVALMRTYGRALASVAVDDAVAAAFAGTLAEPDSHILAELADFCLAVEGVCWAVVGGVVGDDVVLSIRRLAAGADMDDSAGAGALAERLAGENGHGGGHASMARASWPRTSADERLFAPSLEEAAALLLRRVQKELDAMRGGVQDVAPQAQAQAHPHSPHSS
jgi:nanoRNase/pAp phosphatase (c-di-AMP/oligoRNAs hydrolase)